MATINYKPSTEDAYAPLGRALDAESWRWLAEEFPDVAETVQFAVTNGGDADGVFWYVVAKTQRSDLARRCEQAARHLIAVQSRSN